MVGQGPVGSLASLWVSVAIAHRREPVTSLTSDPSASPNHPRREWPHVGNGALLTKTVGGACFTGVMDNLESLDHVEWSDAARVVWAKTDMGLRFGMTPDELLQQVRQWLPLTQHLLDAAGVAWLLFEALPLGLKSRIVTAFGGDAQQARTFVCFLAGIHDVGKTTEDFAFQADLPRADMPQLCDAMRRMGFLPILKPLHRLRHDVLGQAAARTWLKGRTGAKGGLADSVASLIGGHHGICPSSADVTDARLRLAQEDHELWTRTRNEFFDTMARTTGAAQYLDHWMVHPPEQAVLPVIEGLVIQADWIASSENLFPYESPELTSVRVREGWEWLHLPGPWMPQGGSATIDELFAERFPQLGASSPNAMQRKLVELVEQAAEPSLFVLEAPMGQGKTEAALMAAEILDRRFGCGGVFFALPTMATSNPMFHRMLQWLDEVPVADDSSIVLAHSKAALNDEYAHMMPASRYPEEGEHHRVQVRSWFLGRKRAMLANHVVGTIDQALFAALQAKHVVLRQLGIASKVVIIDEVHAADTYMRVYLKRLLTWLGALRTPVILMSATLPPRHRAELVNAYVEGRTGQRQIAVPQGATAADAYPRVTVASEAVHAHAAEDPRPAVRTVHLERIKDDLDHLVAELDRRLVNGGCVAVIRNTVGRAQESFRALSEHFGDDVTLVHSRFLAPDRARKEGVLVDQLGRDGTNRPERLIVVGTQVLEQSLDVDFDLMVTDVAPVDLVMQRIGRLHRHQRPRPPSLRTAVCLLAGVDDWESNPPLMPKGSEAVYGAASLLRSVIALGDVQQDELILPADIPRVVAEAYGDVEAPPEWGDALSVADEHSHIQHAEQRKRAATYLLSAPNELRSLTGFTDAPAKDPEGSKSTVEGQATVRDSQDSLEVIVLILGDDGQVRLPSGIGDPDHRVVPRIIDAGSEGIARDAAGCLLRLPNEFVYPRVVDQVIRELESPPVDVSGWQASAWLRGELVLFLDESMRATLAGRTLQYDSQLGLVVTEQPKGNVDHE